VSTATGTTVTTATTASLSALSSGSPFSLSSPLKRPAVSVTACGLSFLACDILRQPASHAGSASPASPASGHRLFAVAYSRRRLRAVVPPQASKALSRLPARPALTGVACRKGLASRFRLYVNFLTLFFQRHVLTFPFNFNVLTFYVFT